MDSTELAKRFNTDKFRTGIIDHYMRMFGPQIHEPVKLFEIGVLNGGSIKFWSEYYLAHDDSRVIGIDTKLRESPVLGVPITLYRPNTRGARQYRTLAEEVMRCA